MADLNLELYKKAYLIRAAEEKIRAHYHEDEMKTPAHLYIGGEAIAAGVIQALGPDDQVVSTYRSHGVYLAKTGETDKFFAEMLGRATGSARGKAGSMHLSLPEKGHIGASAVVGTNIPVGVGAAFANRYQKNGKLVVVFFGDGAIDEGVFWESLNLASVLRLPVIFVCEDNDLAIHSKAVRRHGYASIAKVVAQFNVIVAESESTDPEVVFTITKKAVAEAREKSMPAFLHFRYYRYYEHVGVNQDFQAGYRSEEEFKSWLERDPVKTQRAKLLAQGATEREVRAVEEAIETQVNESFEKGRRDPFPAESELLKDVYA